MVAPDKDPDVARAEYALKLEENNRKFDHNNLGARWK